jgi:hypothetical protein
MQKSNYSIFAIKKFLGWGHGTSARVPAWQARDPEFKLQYKQKKKFSKETGGDFLDFFKTFHSFWTY